jgi:L-ascorbate metabolism protein UlaG (beta-lactamase superfamily)
MPKEAIMRIAGSFRRIFPALICLLLATVLQAQQGAPRQTDVEKTAAGDLKITPINHASLLLQLGGKAIFVDPVGQGDYASLPKADLILITDIHGDHLNAKAVAGLEKEGSGTQIIAPEAVQKTLPEAKVIAIGGSLALSLGDLKIGVEAVPAYNLTRGPTSGQLYHTKGRGVGYVLNLGGKHVYISGDTECIPEMKQLKNIDIAFLCMNLPYTQTPQEAAECVKAFRPRVIYPYHYRGQDLQVLVDALKGEKGIEVRLRNWY